MHLLAAQPGGFVDDEGIIDLDQSPAKWVVFSAADSQLSALANALDTLDIEGFPSVRLVNWLQLKKPAAFDLYADKVLGHTQLVIVSLLGGKSYWPYAIEQLQLWLAEKKERRLIIVPGDDSPDESLSALCNASAEICHRVWQYLRQSGHYNATEFFRFLAAEYFQIDTLWREPKSLPPCTLYFPPALATGAHHVSLKDCLHYWQKEQLGSVAILLFYRSHLQAANTEVFDGLIKQLQQQGIAVLPIAINSLKDTETLALINQLIADSGAKLMINTTGFASNTVANSSLSAEPTAFVAPFVNSQGDGLPVLQLILSSSTYDDWQSYSQGLRTRDIAMQVVLPELDGRIITRAVSFKAESHYSEKAEMKVVRYELEPERAEFVSRLASNWLKLAITPNHQKRLAIILANYPTKDGRIGNGVGLDTPASTVNLLNALKDAAYPLEDVPQTGNALIERLLESVTNNPNTLHFLPCWQSLSLDDYQAAFSQIPESAQQQVIERWGVPEQDHKCRQGRMMIAGVRLGETFVGIQPARGFNIDLSANYHDPDLIPPHSYLAFYFWLRHVYQVQAVIHVGKHGNIEWLPGKGTALSETCWPDIALGPMPHFYPFIVNDPGEGAQAKRRTQAVIIDHLMPPLTRSETYGELAELEALVDEYYQALGLDVRREVWLRKQILEHLKAHNMLEEICPALALKHQKEVLQDQDILSELDAYLCDIKEAQIRHGLHILGELPNNDKLADTLVALLRLPRGTSPHAAGILHALAADFSMNEAGEANPFDWTAVTWKSNKPDQLMAVDESFWRTGFDSRERLELYAVTLINDYVLADKAMEQLNFLPKAQAVISYAKQVLLAALNQSVNNEIQALITGLSAGFVEPGPSGAPSRGRLDTLPTGRNFFSVDNRAIPSKAAWALGKLSAQALIERHLQDHGDYPRQLGLSVWGTATMRTGGDDIAQAFALMGVKPIWAQGSQRVVDIGVIPGQLLGRPRVDVTLKVSGFFRDAFPNVMKLFDQAVLAIAQFDDPANLNPIRDNIHARAKQLVSEGMDKKRAQREASYRVFGSKPGAYGAGLQGLIDERCWTQRSDLSDAFVHWGAYAYGFTNESSVSDGVKGDGIQAVSAFKHQLSTLDAVVQNQDNREHDLLDSDDYYQFQGGLTNAVTVLKGKAPAVYHNDHSNPHAPKVRTLKEELNRVIRSRVLNPKWINAMREHHYKGAFEMAASVDYLFAYDATTDLIDDYQYQAVSDALIFDAENQQFLQENNPKALEEMAERMLEACQRGLWQEPGESMNKLQDLLLEIDSAQETRRG